MKTLCRNLPRTPNPVRYEMLLPLPLLLPLQKLLLPDCCSLSAHGNSDLRPRVCAQRVAALSLSGN